MIVFSPVFVRNRYNDKMQPETSRVSKRFRVFKNGDESFGGRQVIISQKNVKSWDSFLAEVTRQLGSRVAVRSLHTPVNGTEIRSFDELADKLDYVAVCSGAFKKLRFIKADCISHIR